jgi:hypothetical protein
VSVNETLIEAKMCTFTLEYTHFIFNKCPIYTHDGASAKFNISCDETDYRVGVPRNYSKEKHTAARNTYKYIIYDCNLVQSSLIFKLQ